VMSNHFHVLVEGTGRALITMAAYIDLNPVRAGMVESPEEYRWSGFGEASAGSRQARVGLGVAAHAAPGGEVAANRVMSEYRLEVYGRGEESGIPEGSTARGEPRPKRCGVTRERVEEVKSAGGKLTAWEALRCRVRYFSDGVVLGSKAYVEEHFAEHRWRFGPRRKSGARKMRYVDFGGLCTVRDLQKEPVLPSG